MGYANIQADSNFYRQSLNADGVKYVTGPYTSLYEDVFRAVTVTTDSVVSVTSYVGDSLSNQFLLAGTEIYGLFSSVTIHSGKAVLHLAGASYISEIINQYSASGIPLGFYEEGTQCLSQKISALLTQGLFDDASWVMVPSQYEEDWVRAFKPTSDLGNLAFTRSSDATFTDSTGVVRRSPWNLLTQSVWTGGGVNVAPTGWAQSQVTGNFEPQTAINGSVPYRFYGTSARRFFLQNVSLNAGQDARVSLFVNSVSVATDIGNILVVIGASNLKYYVNNVEVISSTLLTANSRIAISFTAPTTGAYPIRIGGGSSNASTYDYVISQPQIVEGTEALPYFATTDRLNVPRLDYMNADGTLSTCPRLLLEPQRTNSIRNSSMVGAVAGTPGTLPTNWAVTNLSVLTQTIVGTGVENGLPYFDIRYNGTATSNAIIDVRNEANTQIAASNGQSWTYSAYLRLVSAVVPPASVQIGIYERTSAGSFIIDGFANAAITSTLKRFSLNRTLSGGATVAFTQPLIQFSVTNGVTYDFTIRIAAPQIELGAYATTWVPTTTAAVTRLVDIYSRNDIFTNGLVSAAGGTLILDLRIPFALRDNGNNTISISDATGQNQLFIYGGISGNTYVFGKFLSGTFSNVYFSVANPANNIKIAIKWNGTSADLFQNGVKVVSATAFTATTSLQFLRSNTSGVGSIVQINQMLLAPTPLSDAECIALTTL